MSIRARMTLSVFAVFLVGAIVIAFFMRSSYQDALDSAAQLTVSRAATIFSELLEADTAKLSATLTGLSGDDTYRALYLAKDREGLQAAAAPVFKQLKDEFQITHWYFETPETSATVFLRVHRPEQFDDGLKRKTYVKAVETKGFGTGLELGKTAVALRAVHPYYAEDGTTLIGYLELGQEIDTFLEQIKEQTGDEVAMLLKKDKMDEKAWGDYVAQKGLENSWADQDTYVLAGSTSDEVAKDVGDVDGVSVPAEGVVTGIVNEGDRTEVRGAFPIKDASGEEIGVMFVEHDITEQANALFVERLTIMGVVIAMMLAVTVVIIILMNSLIFGRLAAMMSGMEDISTRLAGGDFEVHYTPDGTADEIGRFEEFFGRFIDIVASTFKQFTK